MKNLKVGHIHRTDQNKKKNIDDTKVPEGEGRKGGREGREGRAEFAIEGGGGE